MKRNSWPVLRTYDQNHLARIALPLGGIGTGSVSLGGRGDLRDWEIMNRPAKGFLPAWAPYVSNLAPPVFVLYAQPDGGSAVTRALEGPLELAEYEGPRGCRTGNHGLPRFRRASFAAAYPFGQVLLSVRQTLRAIMRHNFRRGFHGQFNHFRSFVLGDESALLMATYPRGRRPQRPFPYYNEVMTGFEYTAATGMLYEEQTRDGLRCIAAIRNRYDGRKRNPFNEAECGHHYGRAMASWAALLALTGFHYSAVTGTIAFAAAHQPVTWFWSNGSAWGTCQQMPARGKIRVELRVLHGRLRTRRLVLSGFGAAEIKGGAFRHGRAVLSVSSCLIGADDVLGPRPQSRSR